MSASKNSWRTWSSSFIIVESTMVLRVTLAKLVYRFNRSTTRLPNNSTSTSINAHDEQAHMTFFSSISHALLSHYLPRFDCLSPHLLSCVQARLKRSSVVSLHNIYILQSNNLLIEIINAAFLRHKNTFLFSLFILQIISQTVS